MLGRSLKKTGISMWKRLKPGSAMATIQEKECLYASDVIDIRPDDVPGSTASATALQQTGLTEERGAIVRGTLRMRRSTGDLPALSKAS